MTGQRRVLWLLTAVALWLGAAQGISAHGGGTPRLTGEPVGPYRLYAWSQPEPWRAGDVHLSLMLTRPAANATGDAGSQVEEPVTDADLTVVYTPVDPPGAPLTVHATQQTVLDTPYYEADAVLPAAGRWTIAVQVVGPEGRGEADFAMTALPAQTLNWWLVGGAGGIVVIIVALMGLWSRAHQPAPALPRRVKRRAASRTRGESTR